MNELRFLWLANSTNKKSKVAEKTPKTANHFALNVRVKFALNLRVWW